MSEVEKRDYAQSISTKSETLGDIYLGMVGRLVYWKQLSWVAIWVLSQIFVATLMPDGWAVIFTLAATVPMLIFMWWSAKYIEEQELQRLDRVIKVLQEMINARH